MSFGAFAGGLAGGIERGIRIGKEIDEERKKNAVRDLIKNGLAEREANEQVQRAAGNSKVETGPSTPGQAYTDPENPNSTITPVAPVGKVEATPLPQQDGSAPTTEKFVPSGRQAPDMPAPAETAMPPSVSTQTPSESATPATPISTPASPSANDGSAGEPEAKASMAQPTPASIAAAGVAGAPQPGKFTSGDEPKQYDSRAEAAAAGTPKTMSKEDYLVKNIYPKVRDFFVGEGDMDKAEQWDKYAKSKDGEATNRAWAKVMTAPDLDSAATAARELYERVDDGITTTGHKIVTKSDGTQVAVVTMKDKATGKTSEMELTQERIMQLAASANPQTMFSNYQAQQAAAAKMKAEAGIKRSERAAEFTEKSKLQSENNDRIDKREGVKGQQKLSEITLKGQVDAQNVGAKAKAQVNAGVDVLKNAGFTDEEIKPMIPHLLKADGYKKETSPDEARRMFKMELLKSSPTFEKKTAEEQKAIVDKLMAGEPTSRASPSATPGAPAAQAPIKFGEKPVPLDKTLKVYKNNQTGQRFHEINGVMTPIAGDSEPKAAPATPAAQPAPAQAPASQAAPTPATIASQGVAPSAAPAAVPSKERYDAEVLEMGNGKRTQFSPEAQAYAAKLKAAKDAAAKSEGDAYRAKEFARQKALRG